MVEKVNLEKALEEIKADEGGDAEGGAAHVSQDQIAAMLANRKQRKTRKQQKEETQ